MPTFTVIDLRTNQPVRKGDTVTDFRGDTATFERVDAAPVPGKSAKVTVRSNGVPATRYAEVFMLEVTVDGV